MSAPIAQAQARSSVEIHDSCNNCFPRLCCTKPKKPHKTDIRRASDRVPIPIDGPAIPANAPAKAGASPIKRINAMTDIVELDHKVVQATRAVTNPLPKLASVEYGHMPAVTESSK